MLIEMQFARELQGTNSTAVARTAAAPLAVYHTMTDRNKGVGVEVCPRRSLWQGLSYSDTQAGTP